MKRLTPPMWWHKQGNYLVRALLIAVIAAYLFQIDAPLWMTGVCVLIAAFWLFSAFGIDDDLPDAIYDGVDRLIVCLGDQRHEVPIAQIVSIERLATHGRNRWNRRNRYILTFYPEAPFGRQLTFVPAGAFLRFFSEPTAIVELRDRLRRLSEEPDLKRLGLL